MDVNVMRNPSNWPRGGRLAAALLLATGALLGGTALPARADLFFSLRDTLGNPGTAEIFAGQTFSFSLYLSATSESTVGLSYFLETPSDPSTLALTARDTVGAAYTSLITPNAVALLPANALLDPRNNNDLGALVGDLAAPIGFGEHLVATFTLRASDTAAAGAYTIQTSSNAQAVDPFFNELPIRSGSFVVTVNVIPEPGTALLLLAAGSIMGAAALARRRARKERKESSCC